MIRVMRNFWENTGYNLKISLLLVVLAVVLAVVFPTAPRWLKMGAMLISWFADMMLARYAPFTRLMGGYSFMKGAALFMLAHLLYLAAYILLTHSGRWPVINTGFWLGLAVLAGSLLLLVGAYIKNPVKSPGLLLVGILYSLVIGILGLTVFTYAFEKKGVAFLSLLGIISFMFSDLLIGLEKIGGLDFSRRDALVWIFYPLGQLLLIL
ncbi:MAG TPA: hypothetical protein DD640_08895 [Clostridiales bacterium]|nr:hypothetical protein [Clostridiales bacterium]